MGKYWPRGLRTVYFKLMSLFCCYISKCFTGYELITQINFSILCKDLINILKRIIFIAPVNRQQYINFFSLTLLIDKTAFNKNLLSRQQQLPAFSIHLTSFLHFHQHRIG